MWCTSPYCKTIHDLQDTQRMLDLAKGSSTEPGRVLAPAIAAARRLMSDYLRSTAYKEETARRRAQGILNRSLPRVRADPADIVDMLEWCLDEFGPRDITARKALAENLRSMSAQSSECASLMKTADIMTRAEVGICVRIGPRCCAVHDAIYSLCTDIYQTSKASFAEVGNSLDRLVSSDSSWLVAVGARSLVTETVIRNARNWADAVLTAVDSGLHISAALQSAKAAGLEPPSVSGKGTEGLITAHLGPSDWE